jgi:hypothetical protein
MQLPASLAVLLTLKLSSLETSTNRLVPKGLPVAVLAQDRTRDTFQIRPIPLGSYLMCSSDHRHNRSAYPIVT